MKLSSLLLSALVPSSLAADLPSLPANVEIDYVFPRNETYAPVESFPIIFAIQNAAIAWDFGFYLSWDLKNVTAGEDSSFVDSDLALHSDFVFDAVPADPYFIVNYTEKLGGSLYSWQSTGAGTYQLSWAFALSQNCTEDGDFIDHTIGAAVASGDLIFTIAEGGEAVDLTGGDSCAVVGGVVGIQSNLTGCAHVDNSGVQADPCGVSVDAVLASSLTAQLPAITASTTSSASATPGTSGTKTTMSGTQTRASATASATGNSAISDRGRVQAAGAVLAGLAGFCAILV
ncbi:hypothetical protein BX600DRAFT_552076 [Xylariales sp. PMI_506]|nr:hypothetical protein BX600DRAFT_552076 [Xylariales sp. PMI_506]